MVILNKEGENQRAQLADSADILSANMIILKCNVREYDYPQILLENMLIPVYCFQV